MSPICRRGDSKQNKSRKLFPEDFLNLAEFALRFAADFLGRATILQIRIARRPTGLLLNFALCLLNSSLNPIFRTRFHPQTIRARMAARPSQSGLQFFAVHTIVFHERTSLRLQSRRDRSGRH